MRLDAMCTLYNMPACSFVLGLQHLATTKRP